MKKRLLILSGPTHEYIDPVRFIGNASSGKMGKALAEEAQKQGYEIDFITGPVSEHNLPALPPEKIHPITGAEEMLKKATELFPNADIAIFAAAVADYTPVETLVEKMAKSTDELVLRLRPTPDIAKTLGMKKRPGQITLGFALQTADGEQHARRKLIEKNLDAIILNTPATLGAETGSFSCLQKGQELFAEWGSLNKRACAKKILSCCG